MFDIVCSPILTYISEGNSTVIMDRISNFR